MRQIRRDLVYSFSCRKVNIICFSYLVIELVRDFKKCLDNKLRSKEVWYIKGLYRLNKWNRDKAFKSRIERI